MGERHAVRHALARETTRKPDETASTTVARTQPLVESPVTITVSTPQVVRIRVQARAVEAGREALLEHQLPGRGGPRA